MELHGIHFDQDTISAFCRRRGIQRLGLFGSILRTDFGPDSHIDVLVEFAPDELPTLLGMAEMEDELSAIFGRRVDLRTPEDLSRHFRDAVRRTSLVQYAA